MDGDLKKKLERKGLNKKHINVLEDNEYTSQALIDNMTRDDAKNIGIMSYAQWNAIRVTQTAPTVSPINDCKESTSKLSLSNEKQANTSTNVLQGKSNKRSRIEPGILYKIAEKVGDDNIRIAAALGSTSLQIGNNSTNKDCTFKLLVDWQNGKEITEGIPEMLAETFCTENRKDLVDILRNSGDLSKDWHYQGITPSSHQLPKQVTSDCMAFGQKQEANIECELIRGAEAKHRKKRKVEEDERNDSKASGQTQAKKAKSEDMMKPAPKYRGKNIVKNDEYNENKSSGKKQEEKDECESIRGAAVRHRRKRKIDKDDKFNDCKECGQKRPHKVKSGDMGRPASKDRGKGEVEDDENKDCKECGQKRPHKVKSGDMGRPASKDRGKGEVEDDENKESINFRMVKYTTENELNPGSVLGMPGKSSKFERICFNEANKPNKRIEIDEQMEENGTKLKGLKLGSIIFEVEISDQEKAKTMMQNLNNGVLLSSLLKIIMPKGMKEKCIGNTIHATLIVDADLIMGYPHQTKSQYEYKVEGREYAKKVNGDDMREPQGLYEIADNNNGVGVARNLPQSKSSIPSSSDIKEDILTCLICYCELDKHRTLPCLHSFCLSCIENLISYNLDRRQIPCPICRELWEVPSGGPASLKADPKINKIKDLQVELLRGSSSTSSEQRISNQQNLEDITNPQSVAKNDMSDANPQYVRKRVPSNESLQSASTYMSLQSPADIINPPSVLSEMSVQSPMSCENPPSNLSFMSVQSPPYFTDPTSVQSDMSIENAATSTNGSNSPCDSGYKSLPFKTSVESLIDGTNESFDESSTIVQSQMTQQNVPSRPLDTNSLDVINHPAFTANAQALSQRCHWILPHSESDMVDQYPSHPMNPVDAVITSDGGGFTSFQNPEKGLNNISISTQPVDYMQNQRKEDYENSSLEKRDTRELGDPYVEPPINDRFVQINTNNAYDQGANGYSTVQSGANARCTVSDTNLPSNQSKWYGMEPKSYGYQHSASVNEDHLSVQSCMHTESASYCENQPGDQRYVSHESQRAYGNPPSGLNCMSVQHQVSEKLICEVFRILRDQHPNSYKQLQTIIDCAIAQDQERITYEQFIRALSIENPKFYEQIINFINRMKD